MAIKTKVKNTSFKIGDSIRVYQQFAVGDKMQTQAFEGRVIAIKGRGIGKTFTVRKIASNNIGVEKIWPVNSPSITKVVLKKPVHVRRAKLYYLNKK